MCKTHKLDDGRFPAGLDVLLIPQIDENLTSRFHPLPTYPVTDRDILFRPPPRPL